MGRIALVTGGTSGIGAATCKALKDAGYQVVSNYMHNKQKAEDFSKANEIPVFRWDVSDMNDCKQGVDEVEKALGPVEILVNNAGITRDSMMHKMTAEDWKDVIDTNLTSCFNMAQAVIGSMRKQEFGRVISISSINGQAGQLGQTNYSAAKAGIVGFTKALALESASKGITVNAVAPGYVDTSMTRQIPDNIKQSIIDRIPVGRLGQPEEIARCVVFLAADEAGFITGETLSANGGHYME